jgi:hypothetical protein
MNHHQQDSHHANNDSDLEKFDFTTQQTVVIPLPKHLVVTVPSETESANSRKSKKVEEIHGRINI